MSLQIKGKFLESAAVDGDKILLQDGQSVRVQVGVDVNGDPVIVRLIERDVVSGKIKVNGENVALEVDLLAEIAAREAADTALSAAVQAIIQAEAVSRVAADDALSQAIAAEETRAVAAESAEQTRALAAEAALSASISAEVSARQAAVSAEQAAREAADTNLQNQINDIISNVDPSALDSLSEIVTAFQLADSDLSTAITSVLGTHTSELAAETTARSTADSALQAALDAEVARATAVEAALQSELDAEETRAAAAEAAIAQDLADEETRALAAESALSTALSAEEAARIAGDASLQSQINSISSSSTSDVQSVRSEILAEEAARIAADNALQSSIDDVAADLAQELLDRAAAITAEEQARVQGDADTLLAAKNYVNDIIGVTNPDALTAFASLQTLMSDNDATTGVLTELNSVKVALDQEVADRVADVNAEETRALAAESALQGEIDAEETRALAAESALDGRLDLLEARVHRKEKFVISAADIANGYIELSLEAMEKSIVASVGRLMIQEGVGEDYTVSVVGGVSRLTFVGNLVSPSEEQLEEGDIIYVKYMK